jgi:hypothetical protein
MERRVTDYIDTGPPGPGDGSFDGPVMAEDVQHYDHYEEKLKHSQEHKAKKFIEHNCIKYNRDGQCFVCEPIPGYNTRTYVMRKKLDGRFRCNCQCITSQEHKVKAGILLEDAMKPCSHIAALIMMFRQKKFTRGESQ